MRGRILQRETKWREKKENRFRSGRKSTDHHKRGRWFSCGTEALRISLDHYHPASKRTVSRGVALKEQGRLDEALDVVKEAVDFESAGPDKEGVEKLSVLMKEIETAAEKKALA